MPPYEKPPHGPRPGEPHGTPMHAGLLPPHPHGPIIYHSATPAIFSAQPGVRYGHNVQQGSSLSLSRHSLWRARAWDRRGASARHSWDLLQGPLMQAHLSPAQARAVMQSFSTGQIWAGASAIPPIVSGRWLMQAGRRTCTGQRTLTACMRVCWCGLDSAIKRVRPSE